MKINIPLTKKIKYDRLDKLIATILQKQGVKEIRLIFSIIKFEEGSYDIIWAPDLKSEQPLVKGKYRFVSEAYVGQTIKNPTWKEILLEANNAAHGDHVYLESLELGRIKNGIQEINMFFGS